MLFKKCFGKTARFVEVKVDANAETCGAAAEFSQRIDARFGIRVYFYFNEPRMPKRAARRQSFLSESMRFSQSALISGQSVCSTSW